MGRPVKRKIPTSVSIEDLAAAIRLTKKELHKAENTKSLPADLRRRIFSTHMPDEYKFAYYGTVQKFEMEFDMAAYDADVSALRCAVKEMELDLDELKQQEAL